MPERGTHMVNVRIGMNVIVDSELRYGNSMLAVEKESELFDSVPVAKQKLDSARKLYQRFGIGYDSLSLAEIGFLLASSGKVIRDVLQNGDAVGGDILRTFGIIIIGALSLAAGAKADDNQTKTENKLSAVKQAEARKVFHLRKTYPFE